MGGLVERVRVRRHCGPLCSKLVAAISSSICIAVVSVSGVSVIDRRLVSTTPNIFYCYCNKGDRGENVLRNIVGNKGGAPGREELQNDVQ